VNWLEQFRERTSRRGTPPPRPPEEDGVFERSSPGLASFFAGLTEDGRHSILDLGPAQNSHLELLGRYGRRIRFAGLVPTPPRAEGLMRALRSIAPAGEGAYDAVLAWDVFDRLSETERRAVATRLVELTADGARLYTVVDSSGVQVSRPVRLTLAGPDRVRRAPAGAVTEAGSPFLPAHVERMLAPFEVVQAISLKGGFREYVAIRRE